MERLLTDSWFLLSFRCEDFAALCVFPITSRRSSNTRCKARVDNPKTLGKFETGSKAALPIFKNFVEKALYKEDFGEFQIPENIYLTSILYLT